MGHLPPKIKRDNLLLICTVIIMILSIAAALFTFFPTPIGYRILTGKVTVTDVATLNLSVESTAAINFTIDNINWRSGRVTAGQSAATFNTSATGPSNMTNGNWTGNAIGLRLENTGNVVLYNLSIQTGKTSATFLGGTGPNYEFNVSNNETRSCRNYTDAAGIIMQNSGYTLGNFEDVNITSPGRVVCDIFNFTDANDIIRIDFILVVPSDSLTGQLNDVVTATAYSLTRAFLGRIFS